jgi:hypothetical protein
MDRMLIAREVREIVPTRIGDSYLLSANADALVLLTDDSADPRIVRASPRLGSYRAVWDQAAAA